MRKISIEIKNMFKVTLISTLIILCISLIILSFIFPPVKYNRNQLMVKYSINDEIFNDLKSELLNQQYEKILLRKENSSYILFYNDQKQELSNNEIKDILEKTIVLLDNTGAKYIKKEHNNIIVNFTSEINFAQNIVYLYDNNQYNFSHRIRRLVELDNKWYYIEET